MGIVGGAVGDPTLQQIFLGIAELLVRVGRRHRHVGVGRVDPRDEFAGLRVCRHDRPGTIAVGRGSGEGIEPQIGLPVAGVGPVAGEALVSEDWKDVTVEADRLGGRSGGMRPHGHRQAAGREREGEGADPDAWHGGTREARSREATVGVRTAALLSDAFIIATLLIGRWYRALARELLTIFLVLRLVRLGNGCRPGEWSWKICFFPSGSQAFWSDLDAGDARCRLHRLDGPPQAVFVHGASESPRGTPPRDPLVPAQASRHGARHRERWHARRARDRWPRRVPE